MRSGPGVYEDDRELSSEFKLQLSAYMAVFMEKAVESALLYAKHAHRTGVTGKDVNLALKREVFCFVKRSGIYEECREAFAEMSQMSETSSEDLESDGDGEEEEEEGGEEEGTERPVTPDSPEMPFTRSSCTCTVCDGMNNVSETWDAWEPENPLEFALHSSIARSSEEFGFT